MYPSAAFNHQHPLPLSRNNDFNRVHSEIPRKIARIAKEMNIERFGVFFFLSKDQFICQISYFYY